MLAALVLVIVLLALDNRNDAQLSWVVGDTNGAGRLDRALLGHRRLGRGRRHAHAHPPPHARAALAVARYASSFDGASSSSFGVAVFHSTRYWPSFGAIVSKVT